MKRMIRNLVEWVIAIGMLSIILAAISIVVSTVIDFIIIKIF